MERESPNGRDASLTVGEASRRVAESLLLGSPVLWIQAKHQEALNHNPPLFTHHAKFCRILDIPLIDLADTFFDYDLCIATSGSPNERVCYSNETRECSRSLLYEAAAPRQRTVRRRC